MASVMTLDYLKAEAAKRRRSDFDDFLAMVPNTLLWWVMRSPICNWQTAGLAPLAQLVVTGNSTSFMGRNGAALATCLTCKITK